MAKVSVDANPLKWWKDNEHQCPNLSRLSKHYLAVQPTSMESESVLHSREHCDRSKSSPFSRECGHSHFLKEKLENVKITVVLSGHKYVNS